MPEQRLARRAFRYAARLTLRGLIRLTTRLHIDGLDNIPQSNAAIIAFNHLGHLDPLLVCAFSPRAPDAAKWLAPEEAETLLDARSDANITPQQASDFVQRVIEGFDHVRQALNGAAEPRGQEVLDAHRRVRAAARMTGVRYAVQPQLPPDVLGIFVLLPMPGATKP
jgi:hypothetical protein